MRQHGEPIMQRKIDAPQVAWTENSDLIPDRVWIAVHTLLRAHDLAQDSNAEPLQFAVEIQSIIKSADRNDLRWLMMKNVIEHYRETTAIEDSLRAFQRDHSMKFTRRSCFILSPVGVEHVRGLPQVEHHAASLRRSEPVVRTDRPTWDSSRQTLRFGENLVKQFRVPSPNQQAILSAFEEEDWPPRILDPLPPHPAIDPKRRLHDAIKGLNRNQKSDCVRFLGDGTGEGVQWEAR